MPLCGAMGMRPRFFDPEVIKLMLAFNKKKFWQSPERVVALTDDGQMLCCKPGDVGLLESMGVKTRWLICTHTKLRP